ncbi:MAG TPA: glycosyltransferase family 4 protein [Acidimicrobiales bacterium]|jgi:glycosyltransferase involved in cell wall biosynthesis|nr:glycosyltransferase family 4 protein [Acidimicrobiales bacterium]
MTRGVRSRADGDGEVVLHVVTAARRRGAETFAVDLAESLSARGTPSEVVALAPADAGDPLPVPVLGRRALAPATLRALRRRARRARAVVAHGSRTLPAAALALAGLRTPAVYRSIGDPAAWAGTGRRRLQTRLLLSRMDAVTVLWPAAADEVHRLHGVPRSRLHVLPNAVPAHRCPVPGAADRAAARQRFALPTEAPVVAVVGALAPEKRVGDVIAAVAALPDANLLVAGDGPERAALEERAAAEAPGRVVFAGSLPGPAAALAAADVVALPSRTEGMPGVLIEAGLSGLPAVATDVGGVDQVVVDGETGVLVPPGDVAALTAGLRRALAERDRLGAAARRRCLDRFEIGPVADRWRDLLATLTDPDPGPAGGARRRPPGRRRRHGRGRAPTLGRPADQGGGSTP